MNASFPDGHGEWIPLTKYDYDVSTRVAPANKLANATLLPTGYFDKYVYFFWRAVETLDLKDFSKLVDAQDWTALRAKYPPI